MDDLTTGERGITVEALYNLKRGEQYTYYRGNLPGDIASSAEVPSYASILQQVYDTASALADAGKLELRSEKEAITFQQFTKDGNRVTRSVLVTRYTAIALY